MCTSRRLRVTPEQDGCCHEQDNDQLGVFKIMMLVMHNQGNMNELTFTRLCWPRPRQTVDIRVQWCCAAQRAGRWWWWWRLEIDDGDDDWWWWWQLTMVMTIDDGDDYWRLWWRLTMVMTIDDANDEKINLLQDESLVADDNAGADIFRQPLAIVAPGDVVRRRVRRHLGQAIVDYVIMRKRWSYLPEFQGGRPDMLGNKTCCEVNSQKNHPMLCPLCPHDKLWRGTAFASILFTSHSK